MYVGTDFTALDAGETRNFSFDFSPTLIAGEILASATWTLSVIAGVDASPASHLIGSPSYSTAVTTQRIGGLVAGVYYKVTAVVTTGAGQTLRLWSNVKCLAG